MKQPEGVTVDNDGNISSLTKSEYDRAIDPNNVKKQKTQKQKDWKQMILSVTGKKTLSKSKDQTEAEWKQEKIDVIYDIIFFIILLEAKFTIFAFIELKDTFAQ